MPRGSSFWYRPIRSNSSSVAGWLVPARGTCSRKLSSPSVSTRQTRTPACASVSDRHSPTGPAPMTITRLEGLAMFPMSIRHPRVWPRGSIAFAGRPKQELPAQARQRQREPAIPSILRRRHVLHGTDPPGVGEVEHDAERILVLGLVIGMRGLPGLGGLGPAGQILATGADDLLLGLVEIVHPHAEMIDADLLVALLLEQRDVDGAVGDVEPAPGLAGHFHVEGFLEELGGLFRIGNDERDVAKLGHERSVLPG